MAVDAAELARFAADLRRYGPALRAESEKMVAEQGAKLRDSARSHAPVASGELRDSIGLEASGLTATVEAKARHARFVEYGTSVMAPQEFMRPAADKAYHDLQAAAAKVVDKVLGGGA